MLTNKGFGITRFHENATRTDMYLHYHEFIEICLVADGFGYHMVNGKEYKTKYGDIFIINTNTWHGFFSDESGISPTTYNIMFTPDFIDARLSDSVDINLLGASYLFNKSWSNTVISSEKFETSDTVKSELIGLTEKIFKEYTNKLAAYEDLIRAYLVEFLILLSRAGDNNHQVIFHGKQSNTVIFVEKYVREHYNNKINLDDLAAKSHYSKTHLCSLFKEYTGVAIYKYLQNIRIQNSIKLLLETDLKMTDIALQCGFSDYKSFITQFAEKTGTKPAEYRKHRATDISLIEKD